MERFSNAPTKGFRYNSQGACTSAPAKVSGGPPKAAQLRVFPVVEQHGIVWVWPGDPQRSDSVAAPVTPGFSDPSWGTVISPRIDVAASVRLLVENLLDITHFYPLNAKNIGSYENSRIPVKIEHDVIGGNEMVTNIRDTTEYRLPPMMHEWFGYKTVDRPRTHRRGQVGAGEAAGDDAGP